MVYSRKMFWPLLFGIIMVAYAYLAQYAGLLAERWYFFAEARHPQNLY